MGSDVLFVGFHPTESSVLDADACVTSAVMSRSSAARLPAAVAERFADIAAIDVPDTDDLDRDGFEGVREQAYRLADRFGAPTAVVGLYEHTILPAARLREEFGLPGTTVRTAQPCRDKVIMKQAVCAAGVATPRFLAWSPEVTPDELARFAADGPGRFVVKPRSQSASRGVRIVDGEQALVELPVPVDWGLTTRWRTSSTARSTTSTGSSETRFRGGSARRSTSTGALPSSTVGHRWPR